MKIHLEINDSKAKAFIKFLKTLDYVIISDEVETDFSIPEWHKNLVKERKEFYEKNPDKTTDFKKTIGEIFPSIAAKAQLP